MVKPTLFVREILRSDRFRRFVCWLVSLHIRLVWATSRWQVTGAEAPKHYWDAGKPFILAFWHGRLLMMPKCWRKGARMNMLISEHRDGRIIADAIAHFDLGTVTGSSSKGGSAALRSMIRALKAGEYVGITPDGPRGPRMRIGGGIIAVAKMAQVPVIPVSFSASRARVMGSWDRFLFALPISRGVFLWGEPFFVPADADAAAQEALRLELEARMNALTAAADAACGRVPVSPAPP